MQRPRIGVITPGFATPDDPGLPAIVDLISRLADGHDVRVISLRHPPSEIPYRVRGVTVHPLGGGRTAGAAGRARLLARAVWCVRRLHAERPFDLLHGLWADEAGAAAVMAGRVIGRPVVVSVLGGELAALPDIGYGTALARGGRWTVRLALRGADLVTVGSSTLRDAVTARVPADRVALLPLGVDLSMFAPGSDPMRTSQRTILHVASLEPVKDQVMLLRAFARLAADHRDVRLVICGDGRLRPGLERLAVRLAIHDRIEFQGQLPRGRLVHLYRTASLLAVSSRWEAQSMVAVEAAACGIPVVGTRVGCLPDLGRGALTITVGDHRALAELMADVLDSAGLGKKMGGVARSVAEARFGLDDGAAAWANAYGQLAS